MILTLTENYRIRSRKVSIALIETAIHANGEWSCAIRMNRPCSEVADIGLHPATLQHLVGQQEYCPPRLCFETPLGLEIKLPIIGDKTFVHSSSMVLSFVC